MGKNTLNYLSTILFCFLLIACGKDDIPDKPDTPSTNPPEITNIDPNEGEVGDDVDIIGENFSTTPSENTVKFGSVDATVTNATSTKLDVTVPDGAETAKITVTVNNQTATSENEFVVIIPEQSHTITGFSPMEGVQGDYITITGTNFGDDWEAVEVYFSGAELKADVDIISSTEIEVAVPADAISGPIQITIGENAALSTEDFTMLPWRQLADFPGEGRDSGFMVTLGDKVFAGLGVDSDGDVIYNDIWQYDPTTDTWVEKASFPHPDGGRFGFFYFVVNDILYIGGGANYTESIYNDLWKYSPTNDSWIELGSVAHLENLGRVYASSFTVENKGYVQGGSDSDQNVLYNDLWQYDPTSDSWQQKTSLPSDARYGGTGFSLQGKGYIAMGFNYNLPDSYINDLWEYDPSSNSWQQKESNPSGEGRARPSGLSIGTYGYVGFGVSVPSFSDFWAFNPEEDSWSRKSDFPGEENTRYGVGATAINGKAYFGLGYYDGDGDFNEGYRVDFWEYNPVHDQE